MLKTSLGHSHNSTMFFSKYPGIGVIKPICFAQWLPKGLLETPVQFLINAII